MNHTAAHEHTRTPQADGHPGDDMPMVSEPTAMAICPGPFTAEGETIRDRDGRLFAMATTTALKGITDFKYAVARQNALRIVTALNGQESRQNAIYAARQSGAHTVLYRMAKALDAAHGGAPIQLNAQGRVQCALCLGLSPDGRERHAHLIDHDDDCPIVELSEALAAERDGRGWSEVVR